MQRDMLKQFVALRESLLAEQAALEERLAQIKAALVGEIDDIPTASGPRGRRRAKNTLSLKEAVLQATTGSPVTKEEILQAVQKLGYAFNTTTPMNSINVVLYGKKPKFKNEDGKFSPVK